MKIDKEKFIEIVSSGLLQYRQNVQQQRAQTGSPLEYIRLNAIDATVEAIQDYLNQVMNEIQEPEEPAPGPVKEEPGDPDEQGDQPDPEEVKKAAKKARRKKVKSGDQLREDLEHVVGEGIKGPGDVAYDITEAQKGLEDDHDGE